MGESDDDLSYGHAARLKGGTVMSIQGEYLGMSLSIDDLDQENVAYFRHCAAHAFHLQKCDDCGLLSVGWYWRCPKCRSWDSMHPAVFKWAERAAVS